MTGAFIQDAIVTGVMIAAAATVARRVIGFAAIKDGVAGKPSAGCDKCAMAPLHQAQGAAGRGRGTAAPGGGTVHPVMLIRKPTSSRTTSA